MKIKICHVTSSHNQNDTRIFKHECVSLANAGYDVCLVAEGKSNEIEGVSIIGAGFIPKDRWERLTKFKKKILRMVTEIEADIYHLHDPELLPLGVSLSKQGKKVIFDAHEEYTSYIVEKKYIPVIIRKIMQAIFNIYYKRAVHLFDGVISAAEDRNGPIINNCRRLVTVGNYPVANLNRDDNFDRDAWTIVFAGGITEQWSHEMIVGCLDKLPKVRYELCGGSSEEYLHKLEQLPGWAQVNYHGIVSHGSVCRLLKKATIGVALCQPSNNTNGMRGTLANTKLFEMMNASLPVICTSFSLWAEIVNKYHCGICIDPNNEEAFVRAVHFLLDNPDEAKKMGANGRYAVLHEYNWKTQEEKLLSLYKSILE